MELKTVLDNISFNPDIAGIIKTLHIKQGSRDAEALAEMVDSACRVARPKGLSVRVPKRRQGACVRLDA